MKPFRGASLPEAFPGDTKLTQPVVVISACYSKVFDLKQSRADLRPYLDFVLFSRLIYIFGKLAPGLFKIV
jgi:hypothetical protein